MGVKSFSSEKQVLKSFNLAKNSGKKLKIKCEHQVHFNCMHTVNAIKSIAEFKKLSIWVG